MMRMNVSISMEIRSSLQSPTIELNLGVQQKDVIMLHKFLSSLESSSSSHLLHGSDGKTKQH